MNSKNRNTIEITRLKEELSTLPHLTDAVVIQETATTLKSFAGMLSGFNGSLLKNTLGDPSVRAVKLEKVNAYLLKLETLFSLLEDRNAGDSVLREAFRKDVDATMNRYSNALRAIGFDIQTPQTSKKTKHINITSAPTPAPAHTAKACRVTMPDGSAYIYQSRAQATVHLGKTLNVFLSPDVVHFMVNHNATFASGPLEGITVTDESKTVVPAQRDAGPRRLPSDSLKRVSKF